MRFSRPFVPDLLPGFGPVEVSSWVRRGLAVGRLLSVSGQQYIIPVPCCPDDCNHLVCVNNSWWFWCSEDKS